MTAPDPIRRAAEKVADRLFRDILGQPVDQLMPVNSNGVRGGGLWYREHAAAAIESILREQLGRASHG